MRDICYTAFMNADITISLPLLSWAVFGGAALLTAALGAILAYHWYRYAMNPRIATLSFAVYSIVSFILLTGLFASAIAVGLSV